MGLRVGATIALYIARLGADLTRIDVYKRSACLCIRQCCCSAMCRRGLDPIGTDNAITCMSKYYNLYTQTRMTCEQYAIISALYVELNFG